MLSENEKNILKCAIMQPTYNPWLGYFDLIDSVDIFVYLDDVQLVKRSWQVRNRIKTDKGELFLTIPVKKVKDSRKTLIKDAVIDDTTDWRKKHLRAIELNYKKAPYFNEVFSFIRELIESPFKYLGDFNINFIEKIKDSIGIATKTMRSSHIKNITGKKDNRLANICKHINCNIYISPQGSASYIEKEYPGGELEKNNIKVYYHNYEHPVYTQLYGKFLPFMGIIDLLFNVGFKDALEIIRKGRRNPIYCLDYRKKFMEFYQ
ncbi:WbqC-like protein family protein [Persephonella hydrogeniphila]|uniref:WbqC-like protein family protein n=1 Tax=Persephonella hydrogeniphila TaxID=198703 RepID=A0A285N2S4_9AQUI|nr:WbqC family protein [Persephonella hydrogeniphila]SNZ03764.1 WbqC-like protein family protein [Persephonella hydrogeniphila]